MANLAASGGAAAGANAAGGNAGSITVNNTGSGNISTGTLTAQTGNAVGAGAGGTAGSVSVANTAAAGTLSTAAIATNGGVKGNGGNVSLSAAGQVSVLNSNIATSGGTTVNGLAGRDAGSVTISGAGLNMGTGTITASGGAAAATSSQKGGSGAAVSITSTGTVATAAITASGGAGGTTGGDGGNAGSISVANTVAGSVTVGALAAQSGNAVGAGVGGAAGSITLSNTAGNLTTGTLTTTGGTSGNGGNVSVTAASGAVAVGAIVASGGAATGTASGRNAGTVGISGAGVITAAITANGTNGSTIGAGGNGGAVTVSSTAAISSTGAISAIGGNGAGANQAGGQGAAVFVASTGGNVSVAAVTTTGGNGGTGVAAGGNAGAITLDAAGGAPAITLSGNLTALGGNQAGGAISGSGGAIQVKDDALLNAATVTVDSRGGNTGAGAGANIQFDGAINSQASGRALVLQAGKGDVAVTGTVGGTLALSALTVTANDIAVGAIGGASAGVTGATSLTAATAGADIGDIALNGALNVNALTLSAASALTQANAIKATTASLTAGALNDITFNNAGNDFTGAVSIVSGRNVVLTDANALRLGTSTVSGTLAVNTAGLIDQSGAVTVTGATTLAAGAANDITLTTATNNFSNVAVTSGNVVSLRDTNAVALGASTAATSLTVVAGGAITQTGAITTPTLAAKTLINAGAAITLNNAGNDVGTVTLQARNGADTANAAGAISYRDATGFDVAAVNTTGALTLQSGGNITQTGAVNAASLAAAGTGAGSLNFGTQANNIAALNAITAAGGFALTNGNNAVTVAGNISATNNAVSIDTGTGAYTQNANIDVAAGSGPITVTADTVNIAANTGNNALTTSGVLTLKAKTANRTMSLAGAAGFDLSAAELTAMATGATGPIVIGDTASTGAMTIGGAVNLAGKTLTLNAGAINDVGQQTITAQNITLNANGQIGTDASNGIDVAATNLSVNTTGNASAFVRSTGAVNLGAGGAGSSVGTGTLDLAAQGAVTQTAGTGNITAGALKVKTLLNGGAAITLNNSGNANTTINLQSRDAADAANAAGAIQYRGAAGFDVAAIATTGNATLSAGGAVSQSGAVAASGLALTGAAGAYTLANAGNAVTTLAANAASVDYKQAGALVVGAVGATTGVTASGTVKIETTGAASNLTLNNAVSSSATGDAIVLKAGSANAAGVSTGGQLINNVGAGGIVAASGRYLAYSGDPGATLEGVAGYSKRYNSDASYVPAGSASTFLYRIAPTLTVTADNKTKVYGDTNPVLTGVVGGLIDGDTAAGLGVNYTTTAVDRTAVAAGPVAITAGTGANSENYTLALTNGALTITPRALTVSATGQNRVYDGGVAATVALTDNRLAGDVLTATNTAASFLDKNVGTGKTVNVSGIALTGTDAGNYTANTTAATTADITARALTVTAAGTNKVYDGNVTAGVTLGDNRVAGDQLAISNAAASFGDKNVGTGKAVSVSGIAVTGTDAGNYTFNTTAATAADITPRALTVSATAQNRVYDGGTAATVALGDNRLAGDVLTATNTAASFLDKNVGTGKTVNVGGIAITGTDAANYSVNATAVTTANITPASIANVSGITAADKMQDGTTAATLLTGGAAFTGRIGADVLAVGAATGNFDTPGVGNNKPVSITGITLSGADAGNYVLLNNTAATTATITAAPANTAERAGDSRLSNGIALPVLEADDRREQALRRSAGIRSPQVQTAVTEPPTFRLAGFAELPIAAADDCTVASRGPSCVGQVQSGEGQ
ncbi:S-layer family protein [Polaromonas sp. Pch-P]|uniref:beta strand repeat-containing protein n=1 Tax=Polaromonas sp. Pch-P TaxID=2082385 RepID=UPI00129D4568|nr:YDG domain-containing protein [Polaromonas sp. Pch-P]QGJ17343.1 hypothetical protein F7R28_02365 [Polaromonas sp. Pch-P]